MECFIGVDVGSVSAKIAVLDMDKRVIFETYLRTHGSPVEALQGGFQHLQEKLPDLEVLAAGTTGSGRHLAAVMIGADTVKNEITAHAVAAREINPEVRTVIDIGGQDSKIIFLKDGVSCGFNMNSVCAAGTGSFLDHQATRLNVPIEKFGELALRSRNPVRIAGRCGVFAESDLISKQQMGYSKEDLIAGLCLALARNYLANVARGKEIRPVVLFQGGVAANVGMRAAFETLLGLPVVVPPYYRVMGAIGAALLARERWLKTKSPTAFRGARAISLFDCSPRSFICNDCTNNCKISELYLGGEIVGRWGSRCGKWANLRLSSAGRQDQREKLRLVRRGA
ncbi:BadF/BadG/BcrA/BcrD ATPase family protein [Neomoorella glycerini]|uniref:BadF/BadG/BcrA/BcrD ATPase family protein n=1 Tax=Neomoorella glycerini TaxID=55779 RepID=A0A6I5ZWL9_9FIRM|nr:acyl-CoA dehydratase activase [Moorella glycerini]QGP93988.1 BadF/BadG/BcrA/BcrD ATPase family protein [Moorella glycerini]